MEPTGPLEIGWRRPCVATVKGALGKGFSRFLGTSNKGKGGLALLDEKNGLRPTIPRVRRTH